MQNPRPSNQLPKISLRSAEYAPVCISTPQGKMFFSSEKCAEEVLSALLFIQARRNQ